MPDIISAVFDTPDMADFALMRLRSEKIVFDSYDISRVKPEAVDKEIGMIVNPYDPNHTATNANNMSAVGSIGQYGGFLYRSEDRRVSDTVSDEVRMRIRVHSAQAGRASASLRSCHGYQIKIES